MTVIAREIDGKLWGVTSWKSSGADRRDYEEQQR
jgi:hypothetical protein